MESYSSTEVACLLSLIKSINDDRISDAQKTLVRFQLKFYQVELKNLINRYSATQLTEKEIERLIKDNIQLQYKNKKLKQKLTEEKKRKACKQELEKEFIAGFIMMDLLVSDNLSAALKQASQQKSSKLQTIVQDLIQYRWIKQTLSNHKIQKYTQPVENIDFSMDTKHIKTIISNSKHLIKKYSEELLEQLQKVHQHNSTSIKVPSSLEVSIKLNNIVNHFKHLKDVIQKQRSQFREMIKEACKRRDISIKNQFDNILLLKMFIESFEYRFALSRNNGPSKQMSYKSQKPLSQESIKRFVDSIKAILSAFNQDQMNFSIEEVSLQAVKQCFHSLVERFAQTRMAVKSHKQILSEIAKIQEQASSRLMKMNYQLKVRMPTAESITERNFAEMMQKFEYNVTQLLSLYDEKHRLLTFQERTEEIVQKQPSLENEKVDNGQNAIGIEQKSQADLLAQQIEALRKQLEQAFAVIALQKMSNEKLRQRVKVTNSVQSSFFLSPQFTEDKKEAELQDEICALRIQIEKLKSALEEQKSLNSNFQQRFAQALRKAQATKTQELQKQKNRYENLKNEFNDANEQIMQLNKLLQDNLFASKRMTNSESIVDNKESIIETVLKGKSQGERKNFISRIVQASVILETVETVEDPVLLEKIQELEEIINDLRQMMQIKENQYRQNRMNLQNTYNREIQELNAQKITLSNKIKDLQLKSIAEMPQNLKYVHLFPPGFIFDYADHEERLYLIDNLVSYLGSIRRTRLLFRYDHFNKTNFHRYIDGHRNIVIIIKTIYGKLIAGYSEQAYVQGATKRGFGLILSLWARKAFQNKDQRAIAYDDYYILFGNSELRLKSQELKVFSNFGIANGYYDNKGEKVHAILGEDKERQVDIAEYEIYALDLQD